jgi:hypothetical protein
MIIGAGLVATTGAIHLHLWASGYRTIPTIGPLFLFQGVAGAAMAVALVAWRRLVVVVAAAGFMIATIGGLLLSVYVGLFGFTDTLAAHFAGVSLAAVGAELVRETVARTRSYRPFLSGKSGADCTTGPRDPSDRESQGVSARDSTV